MKVDYIKWLRSKVGHEKIFLNYSVAIIQNSAGEILMQRRADSNRWGLIGGCIELGESFEEALRREIREETGLEKVRLIAQLGVYNWQDFTYPNGDKVQPIDLYYVCELDEAANLAYTDEETLELRWVNPRQDLANLPFFIERQREVIADYLTWTEKN